MANKELDLQAKIFSTKANMSNIYLYRGPNALYAMNTVDFFLDEVQVGALGLGNFAKFEVQPGVHTAAFRLFERTFPCAVELQTEAGRNYFAKFVALGVCPEVIEVNGMTEIAQTKLILIPENVAQALADKPALPTRNSIIKAQELAIIAERNKAKAKLNELVEKKDIGGLKSYVDDQPEALSDIKDARLQLLFIGPKELRVADIVQMVKEKRKDAFIIAKINNTSSAYKNFTDNETTELNKMGVSDELVAAMINVTSEYNKEQRRLEEQKRVQAGQNSILEKQQALFAQQQAQQQQINQPQAVTVGDKLQDELIKQGSKKLLDQFLKF
jgi:hypothetical protein